MKEIYCLSMTFVGNLSHHRLQQLKLWRFHMMDYFIIVDNKIFGFGFTTFWLL